MLVERITLESNRVISERELAPEIHLRSIPAFPMLSELQAPDGNGNSVTLPAPDSDTL
jgi:hypothetical protein